MCEPLRGSILITYISPEPPCPVSQRVAAVGRPDKSFLREVLMFDRLLVPYPDPELPGGRVRWHQPNRVDPKETWDPDRLDLFLGILGTEDAPGWNGAQLAHRAMWSPATWTT